MKKIAFITTALALAAAAQAALKPGDNLTPYTIKNVETGKEYCQVCQYGVKQAKLIAFGKLEDDKFWADLKSFQKLHEKYKNLGVFAQVLDSKDAKAIRAAAQKHGITFPVVVAVEKEWNDAYKVDGVSRTIYYARKNTVAWTSVGLDDHSAEALAEKVENDLKS